MDHIAKSKLMHALKKEYEFCIHHAWPSPEKKNEHFAEQAERIKKKMEQLELGEQILPDHPPQKRRTYYQTDINSSNWEETYGRPNHLPKGNYVVDRDSIKRAENSKKNNGEGPAFAIILVLCIVVGIFVLISAYRDKYPPALDPKIVYLEEYNCSISEITPTLDTKTVLVGKVHSTRYRWNETYMCDNGKISYSIWNENKPFGNKK